MGHPEILKLKSDYEHNFFFYNRAFSHFDFQNIVPILGFLHKHKEFVIQSEVQGNITQSHAIREFKVMYKHFLVDKSGHTYYVLTFFLIWPEFVPKFADKWLFMLKILLNLS